MMKLWRNLISHRGNIYWEGRYISWDFVCKIQQIQEKERIVAANKLGRNHIQFQNHKMKTKFALQVLSLSVADALDFCRDDLQLSEFKDSKTTSDFFRKLDKCFDILNSRNPGQYGNKGPLRPDNIADRAGFLTDFAKSILNMKYFEKSNRRGNVSYNEKLLCKGNRKRALLGTVVTIKSVLQIAYDVLYRNAAPQKYIPTYRFSLDLLEVFFNKVRGSCGRNNNPTAKEFNNIMKRNWHQNLLKSTSTGNSVTLCEDGEVPGGLLPLKPKPKRQPVNDVADLTSVLKENFCHDSHCSKRMSQSE